MRLIDPAPHQVVLAPGLAFEAEVENDPLGLLRDLVQGHKDSLMNSPRDLASPLVQVELE